ncbi:MAG: metallophosphoesterase [Ruminococcus sp.]|nr:metallophosphoesterase [Ruminococcus sp.]
MYLWIIIPIAFFVVFMTVYLTFFVRRIFSLFLKKRIISLIASLAIVIGGTAGGFVLFGTSSIIVILHLFFSALLFQLISFILKKAVKNENFQKKRDFIYKLGMVPIVFTACLMIFAYINMITVIETNYHYDSPKMNNGKKLHLAMIADLHMGTTMDVEDLQKHADEISAKNPDVFVLVGDIVDESTTKYQMEQTFKILSNVKSRDGVYYVYGNHDRGIYNANCEFTETELMVTILNNGIKILKNDVAEFDDYVLIGREDKSFETSGYERPAMTELIKDVDKNKYIINLDHQPLELKQNAELGVDLQLSGHTHGGQIWPAGIVAQATGIFELTYGEKNIDSFNAITTSGIASWGYPFRTEQHSEFVIIDID